MKLWTNESSDAFKYCNEANNLRLSIWKEMFFADVIGITCISYWAKFPSMHVMIICESKSFKLWKNTGSIKNSNGYTSSSMRARDLTLVSTLWFSRSWNPSTSETFKLGDQKQDSGQYGGNLVFRWLYLELYESQRPNVVVVLMVL